jgi:hypothetical protein
MDSIVSYLLFIGLSILLIALAAKLLPKRGKGWK